MVFSRTTIWKCLVDDERGQRKLSFVLCCHESHANPNNYYWQRWWAEEHLRMTCQTLRWSCDNRYIRFHPFQDRESESITNMSSPKLDSLNFIIMSLLKFSVLKCTLCFEYNEICFSSSASLQIDGGSRSPAVFGAMLSYIRDIMDVLGVDLVDEKVRGHCC